MIEFNLKPTKCPNLIKLELNDLESDEIIFSEPLDYDDLIDLHINYLSCLTRSVSKLNPPEDKKRIILFELLSAINEIL